MTAAALTSSLLSKMIGWFEVAEWLQQFSLRRVWFVETVFASLLFGLIAGAELGLRLLFYMSLLYFPAVSVYRRIYGIKPKSRFSAALNFLRRRLDKRLGRV